MSESDDFRRQILTFNVNPRAVRGNELMLVNRLMSVVGQVMRTHPTPHATHVLPGYTRTPVSLLLPRT